MRQILINIGPNEKRVAILGNNGMEEFFVERKGMMRLAGNIYKGVIESIVPGIGAAFINIGTGKNGFLYIEDMEESRRTSALLDEEIEVEENLPEKKREKISFKKGETLLVQVVKEPFGTKGPLVTTDLSLAGKYIVLTPFSKTVGVSKKIEDRVIRSGIKENLSKLSLPRGMGCIARTHSLGVEPRRLKLELRFLVNLWTRIYKASRNQKAPALVYEEYDLPLRIVRDYFEEGVDKIFVDSKEEYKKIMRFASAIHPRLKQKIFYYRENTPLFEKFAVESRIENIFHRKVYLKSGGYIVIEQTEGLVAIDVNTGRFKGKKDPEETVFKTNMEASLEIAKQIMLRDIGGIIVIDFIDMEDKSHRTQLSETLMSAFKEDKAKINILPISAIGLVEMTRQRVRKNLESVLFTDCPYCNGMGRIKTLDTIAILAARRLEKLMQEKKDAYLSISAHPDVARLLESSFADILRSLERKYRKKINVKSNPNLHVEDVDFA